MYRVAYSADAAKFLQRMPRNWRERIVARIRAVAADPDGPQPQVKPLGGPFAGMYRLRVGDWRVIYALDRRAGVLRVARVSARGEAYD